MGTKLRQYTPLGKRISELCGTQEEIAVAIGLDRCQISRKFRGESGFTVDEVTSIANHFNIPIWMFFVEPDMDGEMLHACYQMFLYDPIAFDWIIEAFRRQHNNLKGFGEIAKQLCKEMDE